MKKPFLYWTNDHRAWYRTVYLHSHHWKTLRGRKLKENPVCEICREKDSRDVHHKRYRNIFDVRLTDLLALCRHCHMEHHKRYGLPRRKRPQSERILRYDIPAWKKNKMPLPTIVVQSKLASIAGIFYTGKGSQTKARCKK